LTTHYHCLPEKIPFSFSVGKPAGNQQCFKHTICKKHGLHRQGISLSINTQIHQQLFQPTKSGHTFSNFIEKMSGVNLLKLTNHSKNTNICLE